MSKKVLVDRTTYRLLWAATAFGGVAGLLRIVSWVLGR